MTMQGPSDIPDWYWYEAGCKGNFKHDSLPTSEDLAHALSTSPVAYAHKVRILTSIILISIDGRRTRKTTSGVAARNQLKSGRFRLQIVAPCAFFLGTKDLRVDKGHGIKLYKVLKARGVDTMCNMYDDNHSLSTVKHESDTFIASVEWFEKYITLKS